MYRVSHTHDIIGVLAGLLTFSVWAFFWTFDPRDLVGLGRGPAGPDHWDQLWGLLSRRLGRSTDLYDDVSVCDAIRSELTKPSLASWINGKVIVECMRNYRDWKAHVKAHCPITFDPGIGVGIVCLLLGATYANKCLLDSFITDFQKPVYLYVMWGRGIAFGQNVRTISFCFANDEARVEQSWTNNYSKTLQRCWPVLTQ